MEYYTFYQVELRCDPKPAIGSLGNKKKWLWKFYSTAEEHWHMLNLTYRKASTRII